jgi:hypothetical protein
MLLYHFTKAWQEIEAVGVIEARWPETLDGPFTTRFVHLSRSDSVESLPEAIRRDVRERITVEIPDTEAVAWLPWLRQNYPQGEWSLGDKPRTLAGTVVRDGDASQWYVTPRAIPTMQWHTTVDLDSGSVLWMPGSHGR